MRGDAGDLAANLRHLCAGQRSVSEVCRQIGINRQQFARYLGGAALPSAHNLRRICTHFGVEESLLRLPHPAFVARVTHPTGTPASDALLAAFPGEGRRLRALTGLYHAHYLSPSLPGHVLRALVEIREREGLFLSRTVERTKHPDTGQVSRARFEGMVALHDGTLFLVERGRSSRGGISETILSPPHRGARSWLVGQLLGFSWRIRQPYSSPCVWKRLRTGTPLREALSACGAFAPASSSLDPMVVEKLRGALSHAPTG